MTHQEFADVMMNMPKFLPVFKISEPDDWMKHIGICEGDEFVRSRQGDFIHVKSNGNTACPLRLLTFVEYRRGEMVVEFGRQKVVFYNEA